MLSFQTDPPVDDRGTALPLMRCPANKTIQGIILSDDLLGTNTHYYRGRTSPCDQGNCDACNDGFPWRWHAYVVLYSRSTHAKTLFEMTAKCCEPLLTYRKAYGTLRGCVLSAKRVNSSANSRVLLTTSHADLQQLSLPESPDILKALSIIWNIELPSLSVEGVLKEAPSLNTRRNLNLRSNLPPTSTTQSQSPSPNGHGSSAD